LITVKFEIDPIKKQDMIEFLEDNYMPDRHIKENWNIMRQEVIKILFSLILEPEIIKELREEIREEAELHVIRKCRRVYKEMLMTGPF
jgi:transcriptional accessory protein Tex/SPT6